MIVVHEIAVPWNITGINTLVAGPTEKTYSSALFPEIML